MEQTQSNHDPKLGLLLLGRYRIVRKLGEGGMGAVYEGHHELIGKRIAIKCLHPQFVSNREVVERFYREANAATAVGNEHIIEVTDLGTFDDGAPFIVMEYLDGIEFAKLIQKEGALSIARLVHIVTQVCSALSAAHARGIVHRDMKPENIYLVRRGDDVDFVKVLDFGISKVRESNDALGAGLTKTGAAMGTPYYMSPEQAQAARDLDHRADIYAVGVIMYEALTGHLPFDADSYPALLLKIMSERPAPLRVFRNDVPDSMEQIVLKAMARDRAERFQTIESLAAALHPFRTMNTLPPGSTVPRSAATASPQTTPFVSTSHVPAVPSTDPPATIPGGKKHMGLLVTAAGAVLLIGVVAGLMRPGAAPAPDASVPAVVAVAQPAAAPSPAVMIQPQAVPAPAPQPIATEVQVKISVTPSDAHIFIEGTEFPNPMDAYRPRSLAPQRIRVEARGHETVEQLVIFDQNRQLSFSLAAGRGVRRIDTNGDPNAASPKPAPPGPAAPGPKPAAAQTAPTEPAKPDGIYRGPSGAIHDSF
jgi:serine/threonine-protein kinase